MSASLVYSPYSKGVELSAMLVVNTILAFVPSVTVWLAASQLLASFIYRTEANRPELEDSGVWHVVETMLVFLVFVGSVALWIGLTILLQQVVR